MTHIPKTEEFKNRNKREMWEKVISVRGKVRSSRSLVGREMSDREKSPYLL